MNLGLKLEELLRLGMEELKRMDSVVVRGRPRKEEKRVEVVEEVVEVEVEEVVKVRKLMWNGKEYLRSMENVLYDIDTHEEIGVFNEEMQNIIYNELEEEDEVEDE